MDEADVKTNKNEIEFNSFCLFLSFNFILVFFFGEAAPRKSWPGIVGIRLRSPPWGIIRLFCGFCGFMAGEKVLFRRFCRFKCTDNRYLKLQNGVKEAIMD
jgi:hypothetical protein